MRVYKTVISNNEPSQRDVIWVKPNDNGFTFYLLDGGKWKPIKLVDDKNTSTSDDDTVLIPITQVKINNTEITSSRGVVNIEIVEGTTNGNIKVNGSNVKVHGLGTAAYKAESYFQKAIPSGSWDERPQNPAVGQIYLCTGGASVDGANQTFPIYIYYAGELVSENLGKTYEPPTATPTWLTFSGDVVTAAVDDGGGK